ncbi:hypothetical protein DFAR_800016 [Desulfarculales bacterium]
MLLKGSFKQGSALDALPLIKQSLETRCVGPGTIHWRNLAGCRKEGTGGLFPPAQG